MPPPTISRAAAQAGVNIETIRFYERKGLIEQPPKPASGGWRSYPEDIVRRIRFIRRAQNLGFSLREIESLLGLRDDPDSDCDTVRHRAREKLTEVNEKIAQLRRIGAALQEVIATCPSRGDLDGCSIIAALENRAVAPD